MKIVCLAENTAIDETVGAEHGLSLYIETASHRILFDMGQGDLFLRNADILGVDLASVDLAILSHGHYDHGGGLASFLACNSAAPVYVSRHAFESHWHGAEKYIGLDEALCFSPRLRLTDDRDTVIGDGMVLYSGNGRELSVPIDSAGLTAVRDGIFCPEDFCHEQYLMLEEGGRRILISGCSHKGILNIMHWFLPDVLIGGFHFSKLPLDDTLTDYAHRLAQYDTAYYTCHCTGTEQYAYMKRVMPHLQYLACGQQMIL